LDSLRNKKRNTPNGEEVEGRHKEKELPRGKMFQNEIANRICDEVKKRASGLRPQKMRNGARRRNFKPKRQAGSVENEDLKLTNHC